MSFWICYYHIVWATKHRASLILPPIEPVLYSSLNQKSQQLEVEVIAMNAMPDHIHVAVKIPPKLAIASYVGKVKAYSSRELNLAFQFEHPFRWQDSYGVMTFGTQALDQVKNYIHNQQQHHEALTVNQFLECIEEK